MLSVEICNGPYDNMRKNMPYKKYSAKQKKLAAVAPPRKKITGADFKKKRKLPVRGERTKASIKKRGGNANKKR